MSSSADDRRPGSPPGAGGPFDDFYRRRRSLWGDSALRSVREHVSLFAGSVLDLGAGDGRNALYLAALGFEVTAVDISASAIGSLEIKAAERRLCIQTIVSDVADLDISRRYDAVISTYALHFLHRDKLGAVITAVLDGTRPGGVNLMEDFVCPHPDRQAVGDAPWLPHRALLDRYIDAGWQVLTHTYSHAATLFTDEAGGPPAKHPTELLVARNPERAS